MTETRVYRAITLRSSTGDIRIAKFEERNHVVVPVVALVEGVIQAMNAPEPELVLASHFSVAPSGWNGRPVFLNHPMEGAQPISGNSPTVLERSVGRVFNTTVDGKRLLMEAWIDEERAKALGGEEEALLTRINAGKTIEISTGAFVLLEDKKGTWNGTKYDGVWDLIFPDHLAILSEGSTGACSYAMGCGVRAAADGVSCVEYRTDVNPEGLNQNTKGGKAADKSKLADKATRHAKEDPSRASHLTAADAHQAAANAHMKAGNREKAAQHTKAANNHRSQAAKKSLTNAYRTSEAGEGGWMLEKLRAAKAKVAELLSMMNPEEMGDTDLREALRSALAEADSSFRYSGDITTVYPNQKQVVYQMYEPEGICYYRRDYTVADSGEASVSETVVECERITTYVPLATGDGEMMAAIGNVLALAGARHSKTDQTLVQTMHDTSVSLGADCAQLKDAEGTQPPCGCGNQATSALQPAAW